jgi:hypothetical protein
MAEIRASRDGDLARQVPPASADKTRAPLGRMCGLSGIVFAILLAAALVLVRQAPGLGVPDSVYTAFYQGDSDVLVIFGLYIVPFAGICFLWHMAATRAVLAGFPGASPEIPRMLQQVSGVMWVCMLFAGSAALGAIALLSKFSVDPLPSADVARALAGTGYALVFVYGVRVAGMYMITTTTMARKAGVMPGWLAVLGYLAAAFLLVSTTFHPAILLVFPAWVVVVSILALFHSSGSPPHDHTIPVEETHVDTDQH